MPSIGCVVARSYPDNIIGRDNELPWKLSTDLQFFKTTTINHAVIMGRKTFTSLRKPLKDRLNIVLSRTEIQESASVRWARDPESAILLADVHSVYDLKNRFFIIGGEEIFSLFERHINKVWLTTVYTGRMNGDAKFDMEFTLSEWRTIEEAEYPKTDRDEYPFRISIFVRRTPIRRTRLRSEFLKQDPKIEEWLGRYEEMWSDQIDECENLNLPTSPHGPQLTLDLSRAEQPAAERADVAKVRATQSA